MADHGNTMYEALPSDVANELDDLVEAAKKDPTKQEAALQAFCLALLMRDAGEIAECAKEEMPWLLTPEGLSMAAGVLKDPSFMYRLMEQMARLLVEEGSLFDAFDAKRA